MSFSFEFNARTPQSARRRLAEQQAPDEVKAFVAIAIDNLERKLRGSEQPFIVSVKANGHLCIGADYEQSTASVAVVPIYFRE